MYVVILCIYFVFESFHFLCDLWLPTMSFPVVLKEALLGRDEIMLMILVTERLSTVKVINGSNLCCCTHRHCLILSRWLFALLPALFFKAVHVEAQSHEVAELNWFLFKQCWRINSAGKATADSSPRWHNTVCSNSVRPDQLHTLKWNGFFLWPWSPKFHKLCPGGFNVTSLKDKQTEELLVSLLWLCFLLSVWLWLWLVPNTRL